MTPLITSLKGPGTKMSASIPESHIKIYEGVDNIRRKISKAYCPEGDVKENPIVKLYQFILFPIRKTVKIERDKKFGGDIVLKDFEEFKKAYVSKSIHPTDIKNHLADELVAIFSKVRKYFESNSDIIERLGENFKS